jgi:hypothetical protein
MSAVGAKRPITDVGFGPKRSLPRTSDTGQVSTTYYYISALHNRK